MKPVLLYENMTMEDYRILRGNCVGRLVKLRALNAPYELIEREQQFLVKLRKSPKVET